MPYSPSAVQCVRQWWGGGGGDLEHSEVAEHQIANTMMHSSDSEAEESVQYVKSPTIW